MVSTPVNTGQHCCPPSADIVNNLHAAVSKTECQRVINALVEKDLVTTKLYGKQAIYVVRQVRIHKSFVLGLHSPFIAMLGLSNVRDSHILPFLAPLWKGHH